MENSKNELKASYLKLFKQIYGFSIFTVFLLIAVLYYVKTIYPDETFINKKADFIQIILGIFVIVYATGKLVQYKIRYKMVNKYQDSLPDCLFYYRNYFLIKLFSWKLLLMLSLIAFYLSSVKVFLVFAAIAFIEILLVRPTMTKVNKACK